MDVIAQIRSANAGRDPQRLKLKYRAMRDNPFAFLRGSCGLFYDRLPRGGIFRSAPAVWLCGDLHLENFGSYTGDNGLVYFDINDFDEAALAPASWDLVRLLTSVLVAADTLGSKNGARLCRIFVEAYAMALAAGKAYWVERDTAAGVVRVLLDALRDRKHAEFLDERTKPDGRKKRKLDVKGGKALPADEAERERVGAFMRTFAKSQPHPAAYKMIDVARRIAGTGSLGLERYVVLVRGAGSPDGNQLLDLKIALPSALGPHLKTAPQPRWPTQAERIAGVQQRLQAVPIALLQPVRMDGRVFVLRALQPSQDRIDLKKASAGDLESLVGTMGQLVAWAQLRSAGRDGSASADELIAFGQQGQQWKTALLDAAKDMAALVRKDAATFAKAWDDGTLTVEKHARRSPTT